MSEEQLLHGIRKAAKDYEASEHRLRLEVTAACAAEVPIASIAKAAGVTRQTVYNWSAEYGQGYGLTVAAGADLAALPVQRPRAAKRAPVLILGTRRGRRLAWDGRRGTAAGYAGDRLGVSVPGKIMDVIAESWALAGDSSGAGRRPRTGDRVICGRRPCHRRGRPGRPRRHPDRGRRQAPRRKLVGDRAARHLTSGRPARIGSWSTSSTGPSGDEHQAPYVAGSRTRSGGAGSSARNGGSSAPAAASSLAMAKTPVIISRRACSRLAHRR